ncbi:hypothetical protein [Kribbella sp. CA-247076]|uniref:hypothetical protein n=1 Tax=Kribbella sp. CA-247076 TaxID=3239941 RepID=UPI003D910A17
MIRVHLVELTSAEIPPLREAMGDVQVAVATYYAETARGGDLGIAVRGFLASAQVVNDLLTNQATDAAAYKALFVQRTAPSPAALEVIDGVKYARNVAQQVLHIVRPSDDTVLIGGQLGLRIYAVWDKVPQAAHNQLTNRRTQALKACYDSALLGREVVRTMMDTLRFYQAVNPAIVHRDARGEWTGFPLMSQPGVPDPLHPEEPAELEAAWNWLDGRIPNGDARVVCCQVTSAGVRYLCGFTFIRRHSFTPFAETVRQVERDLASGASYLHGDVWANVDDVTRLFPHAQGTVWFSRSELDSWASPITQLEREADWCLRDDTEAWLSVVRTEQLNAGFPLPVAYGVRRARRLNACVPPSV